METIPKICIINLYLPCRGNTSKHHYIAIIQELEEILQRYTSKDAVFICGDFNASLSRQPPNERDQLLKDLVRQHNLINQQQGKSTFIHPNGEYKYEIDYILKNRQAAELSSDVWIEDADHQNTSDHFAVSTVIYINEQPYLKQDPAVHQKRPNWNKCDKKSYKENVENNLSSLENRTYGNAENLVYTVTDALILATEQSIPGFKKGQHPTRKRKKQLPNGPEIMLASKNSKHCWWKWKMGGSPTDSQHPLSVAMKQAKQQLRKTLRQAVAEKRHRELENIMQARDSDNKTFYQLIEKQRTKKTNVTNVLQMDGSMLTTPQEILQGWATHFESLGTPKQNSNYDHSFLQQAIMEVCSSSENASQQYVKPASLAEIQNAIKNLNNNKAPDHLGLTAEHLKYGGKNLLLVLQCIINQVFYQQKIPPVLKLGIITPVFKKGNLQNPDNYRGITVTPVILKVIEHILKVRHNQILSPLQSKLQSGFTKGTSSLTSALIVSECQLEAKAKKQQMILVTLDTRKAFDVVNHSILLRNLNDDGVPPGEWKLLEDLYAEMNSCVKWQGRSSLTFAINQGVRQGGVLSTDHYKRYNNPLLLDIEQIYQGSKIGNIGIPHTTCADDVALLSHSD